MRLIILLINLISFRIILGDIHSIKGTILSTNDNRYTEVEYFSQDQIEVEKNKLINNIFIGRVIFLI